MVVRGARMMIELLLCIEVAQNVSIRQNSSARPTTMSLEMKIACEKCAAKLEAEARAFICSFECTFCPDCAAQMKNVCANCGGELVVRPRRKPGRSM